MTAYKGKNRKIKDALVTLLGEITYDTGSGAEPAFVAVLDSTKDSYDGSPILRILPNDLTSTTGTNTERDHTVSFDAIVYLPLEDATAIESNIYNQIYDLTDLIVDTVETDDFVQQMNILDPTINIFMMVAQRSTWRVAGGKTGGMLFANVTIEVSYSRDASN